MLVMAILLDPIVLHCDDLVHVTGIHGDVRFCPTAQVLLSRGGPRLAGVKSFLPGKVITETDWQHFPSLLPPHSGLLCSPESIPDQLGVLFPIANFVLFGRALDLEKPEAMMGTLEGWLQGGLVEKTESEEYSHTP